MDIQGNIQEKRAVSSCPQCGGELAENGGCAAPSGADSETASKALLETGPDSDSRFPFWQILPWCLFAATLLLLLPHLRLGSSLHSTSLHRFSFQHRPVAGPIAAPVQAAAKPILPGSLPPAPALGPLTVTLYSATAGRHVRVGTPVVISAYAASAPGGSATLAVSFGKNSGPKSVLSLTQGSLSSTTWTPLAPGRYQFAASALDSRKTSAFSRPLFVWADSSSSAPPPPGRPARVAALPGPVKHAHTNRRAAPRRLVAPAPLTAPQPLPYRVAAATLPARQIADTLAGALRRRGFHAVVRPATGKGNAPAYTVETGDFFRQAEAQKQMRLLQHDGYPSYLFHSR